MSQVRKFTGLALLSTIATILVLWLAIGFWAIWMGPSWFSGQLKQRFGIEAVIGSLRTDFFHSFSLRDLRVSEPVTGRIREVRFSFRPWDLLSLRSRQRQLFVVLFREPVLTIDQSRLPSLPEKKSSTPLRLLPFRGLIENGSLDVTGPLGRRWTVTGLNGGARLTPFRLDIEGEGNLNGWGVLSAQLRASPQTPRQWELHVDSDRISAAGALTLATKTVQEKAGAMSGEVKLKSIIRGNYVRRLEVTDWRIGTTALNLAWTPPGADRPVPVSGSTEFFRDHLAFSNLRVDRTTISGTMNAPWSDARLNMKVAVDKQVLNTLARAYLPKGASFIGGTLSGSGSVEGTSKNPRMTFNANGDFSLGAIRLPNAAGTFSLNDNAFLASVDVASGHLQVHGSNLDGAARWSVEAQKLALADVAAANDWISVAGIADARFIVDPSSGAASGNLLLDSVRWGKLHMRGRHEALFRISGGQFAATADNGAIALNGENNAERVRISDFRFSAGGGTMTVTGTVAHASGRIDLTLDGRDLPVGLWPPLVDRYPDVTGIVNANGSIHGTTKVPEADVTADFAHLRLRRDSSEFKAHARVTSVGRHYIVADAEADGTVTANADIDLDSRRWKLNARLNEASPALLADIAKFGKPTSGSITGFIDASGGDRSVARSSFTWSTGHIGNFYFDDFSAEGAQNGDDLALDQVTIIRGSQALRGKANLHQRNGRWTGDVLAQIQRWEIGRVPLDGEVSGRGVFSPSDRTFSATLNTPVFFIANRSLESVNATLAGGPDAFTLNGTAGADHVKVSASIDKKRTLKGRVSIADLPLEELLMPPDSGKPDIRPSGVYSLTADLSGTVDDPVAVIHTDIRDGFWRGEHFNLQAAVDVSSAAAAISNAGISFANGGHVDATGKIAFGKESGTSVQGVASDVGIQTIFNLLSWPITWSGTTDGTFAVATDTTGMVADIRFSGEHEGFGPFREGGDLSGRVVGNGSEWSLLNMRIQSGDGYVLVNDRSKIYIDRNGNGTLSVLADVRNLQAGPVTLFGGVETAGRWRPGESTEDQGHRIDLDVFARELYINQFSLDGNVTHMAIANKKIDFSAIPGSGQQINGTLSYEKYPDLMVDKIRFIDNGVEKILLNGNAGVKTWDYRLTTRALDAETLQGLLDFNVEMSGAMDVDIHATGSPTRPDIRGAVLWTKGRLGNLPLDRADAKLAYTHNSLTISEVTVERKHGYVAQGNARFGLGEEADKVPMEVNLRIDRGDMALLEDMFPDDVSRAKGNFEGRLRIGGSAGNAAISGFLNAHKISVESAYTPGLTRGEILIRIERNRLNLDRAVARLGHGDLAGGGTIDFSNGSPSRYDLFLKTVSAAGASIRAPQLDIAPGPVLAHFSLLKKTLAGVSRGEPKIDLRMTGPADSPTVAGKVELENTVFTYPPASHKGLVNVSWLRDFIHKLTWDVDLIAGRRTWYQNELVDANVTGALKFTGPTDNIAVNGRIMTEQGSIVYSGNEFQIKEAAVDVETRKAALTASGEQHTNVYLKATAEREVYYTDALANSNQDTIVMAVDRSLVGEIQPRFYSKNNPGLSSQRALQLALGLPVGDNIDTNSLLPDQRSRITAHADNDKLLRLGMIQLLDSNLASPLARALARNTGLVDFIRVSYQEQDPHQPEGISATDPAANDVTQNEFLKYAKGTTVKFGRGLGSRLFADYSFRVDEFQTQLNLRHEVELAYRLHGNLFLRGISELDAQRELGRPPDHRALLENQWRFGLPRKRKAAPKPATPPAANPKAG